MFNAPQDPEGLALAHRKLGYRAAYCPNIGLNDRERIRDIPRLRQARRGPRRGRRWCNLLDADPAKRAANLRTVTEGLALAEEIGGPIRVDIAGSFNPHELVRPTPRKPLERVLRRRRGKRPKDHRRGQAQAG